eukprot:16051-Heterococcus_DN1.PRE.1
MQPTVSQGDLAVAKGDALLASVWAFCQGLLAGVALLPLFQAHMAFNGAAAAADSITASTAANIGRAQFLLAYQAAANETRRLLFVLSALGFTGAIDLCAQAARSPLQLQRLPQGRKQSMVLSVVLHAVCLITTLVCATADAAITSRNGSAAAEAAGSSVWADSALQDPQFIAKVSNRVTVLSAEPSVCSLGMLAVLAFNAWLGASVVRAVAAVLAWLLACHTSHHTAVTAARLQRQAALHTATAAVTPSSQGQSFDTMSSAKLQALAAELRRGAEQAEHTVNIRHQQQQQQQQFTTKSTATTAYYSTVSATAAAV